MINSGAGWAGEDIFNPQETPVHSTLVGPNIFEFDTRTGSVQSKHQRAPAQQATMACTHGVFDPPWVCSQRHRGCPSQAGKTAGLSDAIWGGECDGEDEERKWHVSTHVATITHAARRQLLRSGDIGPDPGLWAFSDAEASALKNGIKCASQSLI